MTRAVLITGSNCGDRAVLLSLARAEIDARVGRVVKESPIVESEPWGEFLTDGTPVDGFLNQVLVVETDLEPEPMLDILLNIEKQLGRERHHTEKNVKGEVRTYESRTIDIDILFFGDRIIRSPRLTIPHPLIAQREFVLRPLCSVLPDMKHPQTGVTIAQMLEQITEQTK